MVGSPVSPPASNPKPLGLGHRRYGWRYLAQLGARRGPALWVKHSPTFIGLLCWALLGESRAAVRTNLRMPLGRRPFLREQRDVAQTFVNYAHCLAESLALGRPDLPAVNGAVSLSEELRQLLTSKRGFVLVTAHSGAWDVAAARLCNEWNREVLLVMGPETDPRAVDLQDGQRRQSGLKVVRTSSDPLQSLALLAHLRAGGIVAIQIDRLPPGVQSTAVQLFKRSFRLPLGPFRLAEVAGVPLVPVFVARRAFLDCEIVGGPLLRVPRRAGAEEVSVVAQRVADCLEGFLHRWPTQWFDFNPRVDSRETATTLTPAMPASTKAVSR